MQLITLLIDDYNIKSYPYTDLSVTISGCAKVRADEHEQRAEMKNSENHLISISDMSEVIPHHFFWQKYCVKIIVST